jgi:membrane protease YdiL (CAAX protease family)
VLRGPPRYQPLTPWGPGLGLLVTVAIVAVSFAGMVVLTGMLGLGGSSGGVPTSREASAIAAGLKSFAFWQILVVLLTLLVAGLRGGRVRNVLALHAAPSGWRTYAVALLLLAVLQILGSIVQYSTVSGDLYADLRPFVALVRGPEWPLAAAVIGIGAPLSEELLFRGFLLSALAGTRLGFWGAALIATGLWTLLHAGYSAIGILEVFAIGLFLSWLLWRTGSLRVAIFCHAVYNSMVVLALRVFDVPTLLQG